MTELAHLLAPLNAVLFTLGDDHVSVAELLGFVTGAASVWLTVLARISNFPVGIANSAFFLVLFLSAGLFADSGLQVVYIVLGFAGWWQWLHGGQDRSGLTIARSSWQLLAVCGLCAVVGTWGLTALLEHANDIAPFWDALTTAVSLAAVVKRLDLTAIVYVLFLAMCFVGAAGWRRGLRSGAARVASNAAAAPGGIPA
jgi:nicotinamide mononucleotide transporter